jgi:hypothetical protein
MRTSDRACLESWLFFALAYDVHFAESSLPPLSELQEPELEFSSSGAGLINHAKIGTAHLI